MHWTSSSARGPLMAFLLFLAVPQAQAQRFFFENVSVQSGLPASKVYTVLQDRFGMVWIGTEAGLASYDGHVVQPHGTQDGVSRGGVRCLMEDRDGRLWVGHMDGGLTVRYGDMFHAFTLGPDVNSAVTAFQQAQDGTIWLTTVRHGAWRIAEMPTEEDPLKATSFTGEGDLRSSLLDVDLLSDGRVCFVEDGGQVVEYSNGKLAPMRLPGVQDVFNATTVFEDSKGRIWVGTQGGGAFRYDPKGGEPMRFDHTMGLRSATILCFAEDGVGRVWIGTNDGGTSVVDGNNVHTYDTRNGLHSQRVRHIARDREGNLLIGTDDGLDIFKGEQFMSFDGADGLIDAQVWSVLEDRNGNTWFGTNGGIVILSQKNGRTTTELLTSQGGQLTNNFIRCMREDDKGYVWIGTENGGLQRYDPRTGKATWDIELSGSMADGKITALEVGQPGELWVGGLNGLRRYVPGSGTVPTIYTSKDGLAGDHISAIYRDPKGTIWVASTINGVTRVDNGIPTMVDLGRSFAATCFTQDHEGRLWVGTEGQGVIVLQDGKEVQQFTTAEGLLSNTIKALAKDENGHVWIGTNKGLNKWRHKKGGFITFTERAGFTGIEVKPNAVWATDKGSIWFGTANGATRVQGEKDMLEGIPPLVTVRGWKVNMVDRPVEKEQRMSHSDNSVRIAYGSVALSDPGAVRYQYMLGGLDQDWQPVTTATDAYYPALPPGKYAFTVKAMDRTGVWSDPPAELVFEIMPPWYRTWWFYTTVALVIAVILFSYIKVRERQLRTRNLVLERRVKERTAEVVAQSKEIEGQKVQIEDLLLNILPKQISEELKEKGKATARRHEEVTVMFTDMKGFTKAAEKMTPEELVNELDECFIQFDGIIGRYGLEKIKTIGDSYMCAGGVPSSDPHHAKKCVLAAMEVRELMENWRLEREAQNKDPWVLRIGIHSGPVVAGVVGKRKFAYDIWGDTVNTASRMESSGEAGEVNISGATHELVKQYFECTHRGQIQAKNKGAIDMYFVRRLKPEFSADPQGLKPNARMLELLGLAEEEFA